MTTLAITPNWKNKSAKFKGTVAAGEHVSVSIVNIGEDGNEYVADAANLRLRVVGPDGRTLAVFPEPETSDAWDSDISPSLRCTLNLNTVQMLKAVPPAANVPLLFVLDAYREDDAETEAYEGEFTLYFKDFCEVTHWPRRFGEEEPAPTDLDDYANIIADFNTRLTSAEETVATATAQATTAAQRVEDALTEEGHFRNSAAAYASAASNSATTAGTAATNAADAKRDAETAKRDAETAKRDAETARDAASGYAAAAAESAATFVVDDTLSVEGVAADAKAVGDANQDLITRIETVQDNLDNEVMAREVLDCAVQVDRQNLANEISRAQGAEQDLESLKADKSTTYTKTEVDAKVAGFVDGATYDSTAKKILLKHGTTTVAEVDATMFIKDGMVSSVEIVGGNLVITFNTDAGQDPISIPITDIFNPSDYYTKAQADALLGGKQVKLTVSGADYAWNFAKESGGAEMDAFMADAENYSVTEEASGTGKKYTVTGYDTTAYFVTSTITAGASTVVDFFVFDSTETDLYGQLEATYSAVPADIPAEVDRTPTKDSGKLATSGGIWAAVWGALASPPTGSSSLYDWVVGQLAGKVPTSRTVNGKALSSDVTLTGADIAVSGSDAMKINAALAGKADKAKTPPIIPDSFFPITSTINGTTYTITNPSDVTLEYSPSGWVPYWIIKCASWPDGTVCTFFTASQQSSPLVYFGPTHDAAVYFDGQQGIISNYPSLVANDVIYKDTLNSAIAAVASDKLDSTSAAPAFSSDSSTQYAAGSHVTYNGKLYKCTTATTGGTWVAASWEADAASNYFQYALTTKTINNGAVSLDDRAINAVAVSSSLASLTVNFPTATSGKARDFGLRLTVASGITTAPELALPQGVTCENADGEAPEIGADGAATILYFTETASGVFLVKGEVVTAIS